MFAIGFIWLLFSKFEFNIKNLRVLPLMLIIFFIGLLPYLYLPIRATYNPRLNYALEYPEVDLTTLRGIWWMFSGQAYRFFAFGYSWYEIPTEVYHFFIYLWRNYLGVGVILGLGGIVFLWRRNWKHTLGWILIFISNAIFFINYRVIDKDTMFLPAFLLWSFFMAGGLKWIIVLFRKTTKRIKLPRLNHNSLVYLLIIFPFLPLALNWKWVDMSSKNGTKFFANHVFENTSQNSLIIGDWSSSVILEYYQIVEGKRPDLTIYNLSRTTAASFYENWSKGVPYEENIKIISSNELDNICSVIQTRKVYMIEYDPTLETRFQFEPNGDFFEIKPKDGKCNY